MIYNVLDIETTGLNKVSDNILEVGYIRVNNECKILGYDTLFFYKPEYQIESPAQNVHHLERDFLKQYEEDFYKNLAVLYTILSDGLIVGKNSDKFDIPFIQEFLKKNIGYIISPVIAGSIDIQEHYKKIFQDWYLKTYKVSTNKKGKLEELIAMNGYNISKLQEEFVELFPECPRSSAHSALFDSYMTLQLLKDLMSIRKENKYK